MGNVHWTHVGLQPSVSCQSVEPLPRIHDCHIDCSRDHTDQLILLMILCISFISMRVPKGDLFKIQNLVDDHWLINIVKKNLRNGSIIEQVPGPFSFLLNLLLIQVLLISHSLLPPVVSKLPKLIYHRSLLHSE